MPHTDFSLLDKNYEEGNNFFGEQISRAEEGKNLFG